MPDTRVLPPAALTTERLWLRAVATFALFVALAGDGLRNLLGLTGYVIVALIVTAAVIWFTVRLRPRPLTGPWPLALIGYILFAVLSLAWSRYPGGSAVTLVGMLACTALAILLALVMTWNEIIGALTRAVQAVLALSIVFELVVALIIRHPVLPLGVHYDGKPPLLAYWSRNVLFTGDRIQGILGNANLLAFVALLGIILFTLRLMGWRGLSPAARAREPHRGVTAGWLALAVLLFALTRSSTLVLALAAVVVVAAAALWVRAGAPGKQFPRSVVVGIIFLVGGTAVWLLRDRLFSLLGKNSDLTGRAEIWDVVIREAQKSPIVGNGFASPWVPWVEPFNHLVVRNRVLQLQAHNTWLDVWMQLGIIGVILLALALLSALWRSWFTAIDRPRTGLADANAFSPYALVPLLILATLLVQSAAESRPLLESGWVLICLFAFTGVRRPLLDAGTDLAPDADPQPRYVRPAEPAEPAEPAGADTRTAHA
ncbi:O-antigen ligase family protein [Mycetocola tolaasinivorans]|uniref:O-antigen ligase family protein n=1 Tax=Mycetocola tolaasinivorans TaxID=76635 RepID=A0A3L7A9E9_9MICO|nr:O-antigen ligase family protein [Mycetocola tolaasinivorans]RLP76002.1 O-antigen ligase family protein [Mycetocola tolaasinivorans]